MSEARLHAVTWPGAGGMRLCADIAGPADGQPVVLMHGGGQTRHAWRRAVLALAAEGWRAIALDARGHGDSAWAADGDYGVDAMCADLRAVVATLARPPVLVGASMGGITALVAAADAPGLARAVVLVDVVPRLEFEGVRRIIDFMTARPDGYASLDEAAEAVAAYNPGRQRSPDTQGLAKNLRQGADGRWRWHWDPRFMAVGEQEQAARVHAIHARVLAAAPRVHVPTLLVRGADSDVVSAEGASALAQQIPHLETVTVPGAGHMVAGDRNDAFNAAMLGFVRRFAPTHMTAGLVGLNLSPASAHRDS